MDDDTGSMTGSSDEAPIRTCSEFEGPLVVDTIDGCEADASLARNVLECEGYIRFSLLHPVTLAEAL